MTIPMEISNRITCVSCYDDDEQDEKLVCIRYSVHGYILKKALLYLFLSINVFRPVSIVHFYLLPSFTTYCHSRVLLLRLKKADD